MESLSIEQARFVVEWHSELLSPTEWKAFKHYVHEVKLRELPGSDVRERLYHKQDLLSSDPSVAQLLEQGYEHFILTCAERILKDNPEEIQINVCPQCGKPARTPLAKQCRFCGCNWH